MDSGGTKLSKGDLALAKICADWPEARDTFKKALKGCADSGYRFNLDWLLRSVNTVLTGEAKFSFLHEKSMGAGVEEQPTGQDEPAGGSSHFPQDPTLPVEVYPLRGERAGKLLLFDQS